MGRRLDKETLQRRYGKLRRVMGSKAVVLTFNWSCENCHKLMGVGERVREVQFRGGRSAIVCRDWAACDFRLFRYREEYGGD